MSSAVWELQRSGLRNSFRVITIDLPGHGNSPPDSNGFNLTVCAEDIYGLLEHLGAFNAILVGWSLGAMIAAETYLKYSEQISALVLVSGTPCFVRAEDFPYGLLQNEVDGMAIKVQRNTRRALNDFLTRMLASGEKDMDYVYNLLKSLPEPSTDVALQALQVLVKTDLRERLSLINCPTRIINGDRDVICLPQASNYMLNTITGADQIVFSGCGHVPFLTQSTKFNTCLEEFRERIRDVVH
jgi:pimeloyl-[acyl-carrier protein] methyl ester esterase